MTWARTLRSQCGVRCREAVVLYASIRKYRHIRSPEQIAHRVEKGFLPILKALPGFKTYYLIVGGDELTTVSLFDDDLGPVVSVSVPVELSWRASRSSISALARYQQNSKRNRGGMGGRLCRRLAGTEAG